MKGLLGKKVGMTSIFDAEGKNIPCTVIECGQCSVLQIKTKDKDGYNAFQIGGYDKNNNKTNKPLKGHFKKAGVSPKKKICEIRDFEGDFKLGDSLNVSIFKDSAFVDVIGVSKGKGFQGVVKRHGFKGVGQKTHGQHNRMRSPGSIGASSDPSRVFKGTRMAGRMGNNRNKIKNMKILKVDEQKNIIVVKGSVPGSRNAYLILQN